MPQEISRKMLYLLKFGKNMDLILWWLKVLLKISVFMVKELELYTSLFPIKMLLTEL